jgi:WD40 repeat protein
MYKQPLLIQDAYDFGPPPTKSHEAPWEKLYRFFFGDDVFISYSRADAIRYVPSLAARLAAKRHICFFDQLVADPSDELPKRLKKKILRSTVFVLIGTPGAVASSFVRKEVELFRRTRRPFIPVDVDGTLVDQQAWGDVIGVAKIREEAGRVREGDPSPEVVNLIKESFRYTRRSQWLRASLLVGVSIILFTTVVSLLVVRAAEAKAATIERQAQTEVAAAKIEVQNLTAQADRLKRDVGDAHKQVAGAIATTQAAVAQQKTAERAMHQARALERQSAERAADTARREAGSHSALMSRQPGMAGEALAIAVQAGEQSVADRGQIPDEVMDGITAAADAADYSLPLEDVGANKVIMPIISPNGEKIVGTIFDALALVTRLVLWDGRTGKKTGEISRVGSVFISSISSDGKRLATLEEHQRLTVWDLTGPRPTSLENLCTTNMNLFDAALDRNGSHIILIESARNQPSRVTVCEIKTGRTEEIPASFQGGLRVGFSPNDEPVVYGKMTGANVGDLVPAVYFLRSGRKITPISTGNLDNTEFGGFGDDGSLIVIVRGGSPGEDCVYIQSPGGDLRRLTGYRGRVSSAAFVNGQARVVTISARSVQVADARRLPNFAALRAHARPLNVIAFSPDDRTVLTIDDNGKGVFWDVQTGWPRLTFTITDAVLQEDQPAYLWPKVAAFQGDGTRLVTGNEKGEIQTWQVDTGRPICPMPWKSNDSQEHVFAVSFLGNGDHVVAAYTNGNPDSVLINFLDARTCRLSGTFKFNERIASLSFSRDGMTMITGTVDNASQWNSPEIKSWSLRGVDFRSGTSIRLSPSSIGRPPGPLRDFIDNGRPMHIFTSDDRGPVLVLSGSSSVRLEGPRPSIPLDFRVAVSGDNTRVAAVWAGEARVWDARSGKLLVAFKCEADVNWVNLPIALSSDGSKLVIPDKDHTVRIYPTSREAFLEAAKRLLGR